MKSRSTVAKSLKKTEMKPTDTVEFATFGVQLEYEMGAFFEAVRMLFVGETKAKALGEARHYETVDSLQEELAQIREMPLVIFYNCAEIGVAKALATGTPPAKALAQWEEMAQGLLKTYRKYRRRILLVDLYGAASAPNMFASCLAEHLKILLSTQNIEGPFVKADALYQVLAAQAVSQSASIRKLNSELAAGSLSVSEVSAFQDIDVAQAFDVFQRQCQGLAEAHDASQRHRSVMLQMQEKQRIMLEQLSEIQGQFEKSNQELQKYRKQIDKLRKMQEDHVGKTMELQRMVLQNRQLQSDKEDLQKEIRLAKQNLDETRLKNKSLGVKLQAFSRQNEILVQQRDTLKSAQKKQILDSGNSQKSTLQLRQLESEKALQQTQIKALQAEVEAYYTQILTLQDKNRNLEISLGGVSEKSAATQKYVAQLDQQVTETKEKLLQTQLQLATSEETLATTTRQAEYLQEQLHQCEDNLRLRTEELEQVLNSNAWKVTGPLRHVKDNLLGRKQQEK